MKQDTSTPSPTPTLPETQEGLCTHPLRLQAGSCWLQDRKRETKSGKCSAGGVKGRLHGVEGQSGSWEQAAWVLRLWV